MSLSMTLLLVAAGCLTVPGSDSLDGVAASTPRARAFNHYLAGVIHQRNGRFEEAAKEYKVAAKLLPDSPGLQTEMAQFFYLLQDFDSAAEACQRALELNPGEAGLWAFLGRIEDERGNYEQSVDALRKAVEIAPDDPRSLLQLVQAEQRANDLIGAIQICERLVQIAPDRPEVHLQLGMTLARINDLDAALTAINKALEIDPTLFQAHYLLGIIQMDRKAFQEAANAFTVYIDHQSPGDENLTTLTLGSEDRAREFLAGSLAQLGQYDGAIDELEHLVAKPEAEAGTQFNRIYLLLRSGRHRVAMEAVMPGEGPVIGTFLKAVIRKECGEPYDKFLTSLDETAGDVDLEFSEFVSDMQYLFGAHEVGAYFAGIIDGFRAEGFKSRNLSIIQARTLVTMEKREEAAHVLQDALKEFGDDKLIHYYLGSVYDELDRFADAERHLKACLEKDPLDPDIMNYLGYMYAEQNVKLDEAEKLLKRALEIDPGNGFYLDSLGWIYFRKGDAETSIKLIRRAIVSMDRDDAILRDHLGDAYLLNGEIDKAMDHWQRARRLDPELEGVQDKIDKYSPQIEVKKSPGEETAAKTGISI
ncbi:MAG: hypothetical protein AMXMBFR84_03670 [Candidatus Hydrogenedentota bacterium]